MEFRELLIRAIDRAGTVKELAHLLNVKPQQITDAKAHRNGLPIAACFQIAELIGEDPAVVVAASELVTEKKPERRAVLLPFAMRHAAVIAWAAIVVLLTTAAPKPAVATMTYASDMSVIPIIVVLYISRRSHGCE